MPLLLVLNAHLPYLLNHGRWPHRADWLTEAVADCVLPLIETLSAPDAPGADDGAGRVTVAVSPVLAAQLSSRTFELEMELFLEQRLLACDEAVRSLCEGGHAGLVPLAEFWRSRVARVRTVFHAIGRDVPGALRALETAGRIELATSAATHALLPLLGRDESVRLQLAVGAREHRRLFGRIAEGCWLPECAYRGRGRWAPGGAPAPGPRVGLEAHLAEAGFRWFVVDAHVAGAGAALGVHGEVADPEDPDGEPERTADAVAVTAGARIERSPYAVYRVDVPGRTPPGGPRPLAVLVRDPRTTIPVWDRRHGFAADAVYLDHHRTSVPEGLRLWRHGADGAATAVPYEVVAARARAAEHARAFVATAARVGAHGPVTAPFDLELFGHWWFEGSDFLADVLRGLGDGGIDAPTVSAYLTTRDAAERDVAPLGAGSWGTGGDFGAWLNETTETVWTRLWALENEFWAVAPAAARHDAARPVLAQAARELLLAQASDWPFIVSAGTVSEWALRRFTTHHDDASRLLAMLQGVLAGGDPAPAQQLAGELWVRDHLFPDVLEALEEVLAGASAGTEQLPRLGHDAHRSAPAHDS